MNRVLITAHPGKFTVADPFGRIRRGEPAIGTRRVTHHPSFLDAARNALDRLTTPEPRRATKGSRGAVAQPTEASDMIAQANLFDPPSGPQTEPFTREDRYEEWRASEEGEAFFRWILGRARSDLVAGEKRFSVRGYVYAYRTMKRVRINNSWSPSIADELVEADPRLVEIIERRGRK